MNTSPRRPILLAAVALALSALACLTGAPGAAPTASVLTTGTPGGSISVSLLTPEPGADGPLAQGATPIGPVATATSAAATAAAQTATASAPQSAEASRMPPAECPAPGSPALPLDAPSFAQIAEVIGQYLTDGGPATVLDARLNEWGAISTYGGLVRADRDFNGDTVPEVLVVALDPDRAEFPYPGEMYIYGCEEGAYRLLYRSGNPRDRSAPIVYAADDMTGDGLADVAFATQTCDPLACYTGADVIAWRPSLESFDSLLPFQLREPAGEVTIEDLEGDGIKEIVVRTGSLPSPSAGPQRSRVTTLRWDGAAYTVASVEEQPVLYRIHAIHEGDEAFEARDYSAAVQSLYAAANDDTLLDWQYPDEDRYLRAYARFRMILAYAAMGEPGSARAVYDALMSAYTPTPIPRPQPTATPEGGPPEGEPTPEPPTPAPTVVRRPTVTEPGGVYAEMARLFWQEYSGSGNVSTACQIVTAYVQAQPATYETLNAFGYANPTYAPGDLCPFGR